MAQGGLGEGGGTHLRPIAPHGRTIRLVERLVVRAAKRATFKVRVAVHQRKNTGKNPMDCARPAVDRHRAWNKLRGNSTIVAGVRRATLNDARCVAMSRGPHRSFFFLLFFLCLFFSSFIFGDEQRTTSASRCGRARRTLSSALPCGWTSTEGRVCGWTSSSTLTAGWQRSRTWCTTPSPRPTAASGRMILFRG